MSSIISLSYINTMCVDSAKSKVLKPVLHLCPDRKCVFANPPRNRQGTISLLQSSALGKAALASSQFPLHAIQRVSVLVHRELRPVLLIEMISDSSIEDQLSRIG